ncbi:MAG TPA: Flp pilus assembly protein CpaB [Pyrinomonadaceae bacterium]|nr:Flp pilus assembly protein CpaB [Pyrinomonadaceae bacterium]
MVTQLNRRRISRVLARVGCAFSTFILAVVLSTHFNPLGPNIRPGDLENRLFPIVVAKVEIPLGTRIVAEQLTVAKFPRSLAIEGAFQTIDDKLLGRVAVARIMPREAITESQLAPIGSSGEMYSAIPEGYRGITIKVDEIVGIPDFIIPGTMVDVVVVVDPESDQRQRILKIVLQNIKVLVSRQTIDKPNNGKEAEQVTTVTLLVTPEQAEKLSLAASEGKLQLREAQFDPPRRRVRLGSRSLAAI